MRAYYYTLPERVDSVLKNGIEFAPFKSEVRLTSDADLFDVMKIIWNAPQVSAIEVELSDRVWFSVSGDTIIVYKPIIPDWIVKCSSM